MHDALVHPIDTPANRRPTRSRVGPRPVTPGYLERAALHYLDRYATSTAGLRAVLLRKARRRLGPGAAPVPDLDGMVDEVVAKVVRSGLVDDRSYAAAAVASLTRRGSSARALRARLKAKGLPDDVLSAALAAEPADELAQARRHAERKRLGPFRVPPDPERRERDLASLCRAGFAYRVAIRALEGATEDEPPST